MKFPWEQWKNVKRGYESTFEWRDGLGEAKHPHPSPNPLRDFFERRKEGPGIWKWVHYFDIYDRHLSRFRGQDSHFLEIGVYSGGSLEMWRDYFGPKAHIYGVDIEPACSAYEKQGVGIFIGDQADRKFWAGFRQKVASLDIVVDDGGHSPEQQIVSVEELLPFLRPGGVYICEDVHGAYNGFATYVQGLGHRLNDSLGGGDFPDDPERRVVRDCTSFQSAVGSIHLYPYLTVIERNASKVEELVAPKHGTQWQPFLK